MLNVVNQVCHRSLIYDMENLLTSQHKACTLAERTELYREEARRRLQSGQLKWFRRWSNRAGMFRKTKANRHNAEGEAAMDLPSSPPAKLQILSIPDKVKLLASESLVDYPTGLSQPCE